MSATPITRHPVVAALAQEISGATPPQTMPDMWHGYRALTAERLAVAIRDYEARQDAHDYLWGLWTSRATEVAIPTTTQ